MQRKSGIEIFTDLPEKDKRPEGPYMTTAHNKRTIYFDKRASQVFRDKDVTYIKFGVDWDAPAALVMTSAPSQPGALPLCGRRTNRGPGTYTIGADGLAFFDRYKAIAGKTQRYALTWRDDVRSFEFRLPEIEMAAGRSRPDR